MNQPLSSQEMGSDILHQVEEGMDVYDLEDHHIGKVERIYFGEVDEETEALGKGPMTAGTPPETAGGNWLVNTGRALDEALGDDELPEVVRNRLLRSGFIQIDTGLLQSDLYAMPDQIATVREKRVILSARRDNLVKR